MSNSTATDAKDEVIIPENIGRNDPCPCQSGRKYKKCCQEKHRIEREAKKESTQVERLIGEKTNAWRVFKLLRQVHQNNMHALLYDMTHALGPFRERYPDKADYIKAADAGDEPLIAGPQADLRRVRLDENTQYLLITEGLDDPRATKYTYQVVTLRPNQLDADDNARDVDHLGLRVWDIQRHERTKEAGTEGDISLKELGYEWGGV